MLSPKLLAKYKANIFKAALLAHRPTICKFLIRSLSKLHWETAIIFWSREPLLWTLEELFDLFPPDNHLARGMLASAHRFSRCNTLQACSLALEFNLQVMIAHPREYSRDHFTRMLRALQENRILGDEDLATLIRLVAGRANVKDEDVELFSSARPNYSISRQALIVHLSDDACHGCPDHVLESLSDLSYDQFEKLNGIVAAGDSREDIQNLLGYSPFALKKRLFEILLRMLLHNRIQSFQLLFSMVDFANLDEKQADYTIARLISDSHFFGNEELFVFLMKSPHFRPGLFSCNRFGYSNAFNLNVFIDCIEHLVAIDDKVLADGAIFSSAPSLFSNRRVSDAEMTVLLGRLDKLGVVFEQDAVDALEQSHPDYALARQFLIEHLPDVKQPADCDPLL
jgi:hypothetical protein